MKSQKAKADIRCFSKKPKQKLELKNYGTNEETITADIIRLCCRGVTAAVSQLTERICEDREGI